jgi:hypothetical protein
MYSVAVLISDSFRLPYYNTACDSIQCEITGGDIIVPVNICGERIKCHRSVPDTRNDSKQEPGIRVAVLASPARVIKKCGRSP